MNKRDIDIDKDKLQSEDIANFVKFNNSNNFDNYFIYIISRISKILFL